MSKIDGGVRAPGDGYGGFDEDLTSPYGEPDSVGIHNLEDPQFVPAYQPRAQVKEHDPNPPLGPVRWFIGALGRSLITAGLLILLFVAYQLWGTTLYTNQQQSQLGDEFEARLASVDTAEPTTSPGAALPADEPSLTPLGAAAEPTSEPLLLGQGVARIEIPKINADYTVVEGTDRESLKNGPGHYPETPLPGETGNAAIAGHRTTYGAPFYRLDELQPGDEIKTQTLKGSFTYIVTEKTIVNPDATDVLEPKGDNRLTLTTCHPKYSAAKRLIITAQLQETSSDQISEYQARELPKGYDESQNGQLSSEGDGEVMGFHPPTSETYAWGFVLLLVGIGWWYEFRRKHSLSTWMAGFVPFFVVLFFFYGGVEEMLPPGF